MPLMLLSACDEQRIRDQSQIDLAGGRANQALMELEAPIKKFPDSMTLRAGLLEASGQAVVQAVSEAGALRATGKFDLPMTSTIRDGIPLL